MKKFKKKSSAKNIDLMSKIVLFTAIIYLKEGDRHGEEISDLSSHILSRLFMFRDSKHKPLYMNKKEVALLKKYKEDKVLLDILRVDIDFYSFVYEILRLWVQDYPAESRPSFGVNDSTLSSGRVADIKHMMVSKHEPWYKETKDILDESVEVARKWYSWHKEQFGKKFEVIESHLSTAFPTKASIFLEKLNRKGEKHFKKNLFLGVRLKGEKLALYYYLPQIKNTVKDMDKYSNEVVHPKFVSSYSDELYKALGLSGAVTFKAEVDTVSEVPFILFQFFICNEKEA